MAKHHAYTLLELLLLLFLLSYLALVLVNWQHHCLAEWQKAKTRHELQTALSIVRRSLPLALNSSQGPTTRHFTPEQLKLRHAGVSASCGPPQDIAQLPRSRYRFQLCKLLASSGQNAAGAGSWSRLNVLIWIPSR